MIPHAGTRIVSKKPNTWLNMKKTLALISPSEDLKDSFILQPDQIICGQFRADSNQLLR